MNNHNDDGMKILYSGRFFEIRLQPGDPPEPPWIILTLTTAETNQSLVLTPAEAAELPLAAAAILVALADQPGLEAWPGPGEARNDRPVPADEPPLLVFPTRSGGWKAD